jgi:hypothetical protein
MDMAANNKVADNSITGNSGTGIQTKTQPNIKNLLGENEISGNGKDLSSSDPNQSGLSKLLSSI